MKLKEVYRYTGTLYSVNLVASMVTFVVMILISRDISKEAMGAYGLFQAYFLLGAYFTGLGINQTIVKYVAERRVDPRCMHALLARVLGIMAGVFLVAGAVVWELGFEIPGLVLLTLPAYHALDFALSYARGRFWKKAESGMLLGSSLATSASVVIMLQFFHDHHGPIYGQILSYYLTGAVVLALFFRLPSFRNEGWFLPLSHHADPGWVRAFAVIAAPIFVTSALASVSEVADRFIIEHYLGLAVLGEYFIAMSFFNILDKPVGLLARVLLSYFSTHTAAGRGPQQDMESMRQLLKFNLLVFPAFALIVITILPPILSQFLNKDYSNAFDILALISIIVVVKAFEVINSTLAIAKSSPTSNMYSQLISLAVYVPLAIVLLEIFGILGVAVGIVMRWVVFALYQFNHLRRAGVATVPIDLFVKALAAYSAALVFFPYQPWAMVPVYLLVGAALKLWRLHDFVRYVPRLRAARADK